MLLIGWHFRMKMFRPSFIRKRLFKSTINNSIKWNRNCSSYTMRDDLKGIQNIEMHCRNMSSLQYAVLSTFVIGL